MMIMIMIMIMMMTMIVIIKVLKKVNELYIDIFYLSSF